MNRARFKRLEDEVESLNERLSALESKRGKHCRSVKGQDCTDCGAPAETRWGKGGPPLCRPCYHKRYVADG